MDVLSFAAAVAVGVGVGLLAHVVGPKVTAKIEAEREKRLSRRERINAWREMVNLCLQRGTDPHGHPDFLTLRPLLSESLRNRLDMEPGTADYPFQVVSGARGIATRPELDEISREVDALEAKWRLR